MSDRLGLAVIGCGMAAKPHAMALRSLSDRIDVRGVFSRSPDKREAFADEHGFPIADSLDQLATDPGVSAALIITPPNARTDLVTAFAANSKHLLCEKPLERTTAAAQTIVNICEGNAVTLGVVFQHRFRAASEALAELLKAGDLGDIRMVRVDVPWWRDQAYYDEPGRGTYERDGGGVLISQAIHTLDLMLSLTGPVDSVQAMTATSALHSMEAEDAVAGAMVFENGAIGSVFATTAAYPGDAESIRLDCDNGAAVLRSGVLTLHWRDGRTETRGVEAGTGGGADPMAFPMDWHRDLIAEFVGSVQSGKKPRVTGHDALQVQRLIEAIERSSASGQRIKLAG